MAYRLSEREAQIVESGFERYGRLTAVFIMVKMKCTIRKALWIVNNIQNEQDIIKHRKKKRNKDEQRVC